MTTTDKLKLLLATCKAGVSIEVNNHRNVYDTAKQALADAAEHDCPPEIEDEVRQRMIDTNTIVTIHFYPTTPIGFYEVRHYDIDAALDEALECLRSEGLL